MNQDPTTSSLGPEQQSPSEDRTHLSESLRAAAQEQHHSGLRRLIRLLARPKKFQLILLEFNSPAYRNTLAQALLPSMPGGDVWQLDRDTLGQFSDFEAKLAHMTAQSSALQIIGLEAWQTGEGTDNLFKGFNYHREAIAALGCTLLLWLTEPDIKQFALEAPDMWAWRTLILNFSVELANPSILEATIHGMPVASARISEVSRYLDETTEPTPSLVLEQVSNLIESGQVPEARALTEKWHELLHQEEQPSHVKLKVMDIQADLAWAEGHPEQAIALLEEMEPFCETLGDRVSLAKCFNKQALIFQTCGKLGEALDLLHRQQALYEDLGDRGGLAYCYDNQALILQKWGKLDEGLTLHRKGQALFEALGDHNGLAQSYGNQANIFWAWGRLEETMALLHQQQTLYEALDDRAGLSRNFTSQASILRSWGKLAEAKALLTAVTPQVIYVCYASADFYLLKELETFLKPMCRNLNLKLFFDRQIEPGARWREQIDAALAQARIGLLLLSPDFFASEFIMQAELPILRERARKGELRLMRVPLRDCLSVYSELDEIQAVWPIDKPYASLSSQEKPKLLRALASSIDARQKAPAKAIPAQFCVLLLATEPDLGETRQKVASYLSQLGIEVHDSRTAIHDCDHVVLLQAWRWQAGEMIQIWEKAPKEKRSLFLISETCVWPINLFEMKAYEELEAFRARHPLAPVFENAEELPCLVGELLDPIRRAHLPADTVDEGLSSVERAYLKLNLPAWRSGRNQLGRGANKTGGHDINRIYNGNLYVPMDGMSQRYGRNKNGEIVGLPDRQEGPIRNAKKNRKEEAQFENRLPLATWAGASALRWLVISGSPGAGKTVFLTRVAAQLAARLLGEELDASGIEALRPKSGLGPIPVVLEAVKLADQPNGLSGVAEALRQTLAIAGSYDLPSTELLERQLRAGRFLLLVDALDEVGTEYHRRVLLDLLKGLSKLCPGRLLLTTRSARYTGIMPYGPEFEIVELMPFDRKQVVQFCHQYRIDQKELPGFEQDLAEAIGYLEEREQGDDGESFSGNALMLTTLCWLYKRDRRLPYDRVGLCSRLVEGLCEARPQAGPDGRILTSDEKRKHLAQLALAMQIAGAQSYGHSACLEVIAAHLPSAAASDRSQQERLLRCLVEQTGLMYYEADAKGGEQLRFVHRLLREYLAALCLCFEDRTMDKLVADLDRDGQLIDPFWYDVVRMLPGVANSQPKAETYAQALLKLARSADPSAARLWGTLAATLKESHHLYPRYDVEGFCREALERYQAEARNWPREARFLLLEGIGALGDPRLDWQRADYWVHFEPGRFIMGDRELDQEIREVEVTEPFALAKYPVTHGEYQRFVDAGGYGNPAYWSDEGKAWLNGAKEHGQPENKPGFCQPNQPRVGVSYYEAVAYCAWLSTSHKATYPESAEQIYLPSEEQWEYAARGKDGRAYPWAMGDISEDHANFGGNVGRTSPVGAYPKGQTPEGLWDMCGNVLEWSSSLYEPIDAYWVLRGGSWFGLGRYVRSAYGDCFEPGFRDQNVGFRLARGQVPLKQKKIERRSD